MQWQVERIGMIEDVTDLGQCLSLHFTGRFDWLAMGLFLGFLAFWFWIARRPTFFGRRFFIIANWAVIIWLFGVVMELGSQAPGCKIMWSSLTYAGIALVPPAWFLFIYRYGRGEAGPILPWQHAVQWGTLGTVLAIVWTNPFHGLFYGPGTLPAGDYPGAPIIYDHGPLFIVSSVLLYCYLLASLGILAYCANRSHGGYRLHFMLMILLTLIPMLANLGYVVFGFELGEFDPTPFLFSFILVIYAPMISNNQMFQTSSIAKDLIFESLPNPVLVIGREGRVLGANGMAQRLFDLGLHPQEPLAAGLTGMAPFVENLLSGAPIDGVSDVGIGQAEFEVQTTPIIRPLGWHDPILGWVLLFFDVTARRSTQRSLATELSAAREQNQNIRNEAKTDALTGLLNRRTLQDEYEAMTASVATDKPILLTVIDIDHFKMINDTHGHATGDLGLVILADCLRRAFRRQDRIFRVGGEEFLLLSPNIDLPTLYRRLDAVRVRVQAEAIRRGPPGLQLRFSAGVAERPADGSDIETLFATADRRLYIAKEQGRDRTLGPEPRDGG